MIEENPATTGGAIKILPKLHKYVPERNGLFKKVATNGDGLSIERHIGLQAHMAGSEVIPAGRLLGLEPIPQEFHHRGIFLQVQV